MPTMVDYFKQEYAAGRLTRPHDAYQMMLANPEAFLRRFAVDIFEGMFSQSSVRTAYMINGAAALRPGSVWVGIECTRQRASRSVNCRTPS